MLFLYHPCFLCHTVGASVLAVHPFFLFIYNLHCFHHVYCSDVYCLCVCVFCWSEKSQRWGALWPDHVPSGHHRERLLWTALHGLGTGAGKIGSTNYTNVLHWVSKLFDICGSFLLEYTNLKQSKQIKLIHQHVRRNNTNYYVLITGKK